MMCEPLTCACLLVCGETEAGDTDTQVAALDVLAGVLTTVGSSHTFVDVYPSNNINHCNFTDLIYVYVHDF